MPQLLVPVLTISAVLSAVTAMASPPPPPNYRVSSPSAQLQNEEQIWVCPTDSTVVMSDWRDFRLGYRRIGLGRSTDGGNTWADSLISQTFYDRQSDPCLDVDGTGRFYACMLDYSSDGFNSAITFLRSDDKGQTWLGPSAIEGSPGLYFEDKQFITVDRTGGPHNGNVYVAWARFWNNLSGNRIFFSRSTDGGETFPDTIVVGPVPDFSDCGVIMQAAGQFAQPIVGSDGLVHVFWIGTDTTDCLLYSSIMAAESFDGGVTFTSPRAVRHTFGNFGFVDGGIDVYNMTSGASDIHGGPYGGNLYLAYADMDTSNTTYYDWNIVFIRSTNGGATWSEPIYVNDDRTGMGAMYDQFHPWLFCNQEGTLIVIFYDQRTDQVNHYRFDAFAAYSFDGGQTFTTNHRISEVSVDPGYLASFNEVVAAKDKPFPRTSAEVMAPMAGRIAEYIGLTAFRDHVNAVWTDTRSGSQDVYGANWVIPVLEPRLITPVDNATNLTAEPTFRWATAWKENDDLYRLEVSRNTVFSPLVLSQSADVPTFTPSSPLANSVYYWRVKMFKNSTGDSSEYSAIRRFRVGPPCCLGRRGNINGDPNDLTNISDLTYLLSYLFGIPGGPAPKCIEEGNANGDPGEIVNISDATYLLAYLFGIPPGPPPPACPPF